MILALLSCLPGSTPAAAGGWTRIEAPAICIERPEVRPWMPASHIELRWTDDQDGVDDPVVTKLLDFGQWSQWTESDARDAGQLELVRVDGAILCRGSDEAVARMLAARAALDAQSAALWIDLEARVEVAGKLLEAASGKRRARSGELVRIGSVATTTFLASFEIEVATDAGVATPGIGAVRHGTVLTVGAVRLQGGRSVRIDAWLDGAVLQGVDAFDCGSSDAGSLELPRVASSQLACSAFVPSGGELVAQIKGGAWPDGAILRVKAVAREDATVAGRMLIDTAAITRAPSLLQPLVPGFPFAGALSKEPPLPAPRLPATLDAGAIGGLLTRDNSSSSFSLTSKVPSRGFEWGEHLLSIPPGDEKRVEAARALVSSLAAPQTAPARLQIRCAGLSADLPLVHGRPARAAALAERAQPSDMAVEIAQQTWLAVPRLLLVADGVALDALPQQGGVESAAWMAAGDAPRPLERETAHLARMQLSDRRIASARGQVETQGEPVEALRLGADALVLVWQKP